MKFRSEMAIGVLLLALAAMWPFWHAHFRGEPAEPWPGEEPKAVARPAEAAETDEYKCSGCVELRRLARRLKAREEGAARRFESAANALSGTGPKKADARRQLEVALRRARDDKRGAAAFRAAALEVLGACETGPGCGQAPLAAYWESGCPPEHPDLVRETKKLAAMSHRLSRTVGVCTAASCPEIDCRLHAETLRTLAMTGRSLKALGGPAVRAAAKEAVAASEPESLRALLHESEAWHGEVVALFLGGSNPVAQMTSVADRAGSLAQRLSAARSGGSAKRASAQNPYWRAQVLSARLDGFAEALKKLAGTIDAEGPGREAAISAARQRAAQAFRDVLVTQMRIHSAREALLRRDAQEVRRCDLRRRRQIARARGLIRVLRSALTRCAARAACDTEAKKTSDAVSTSGLDPVSAQRLRLDLALGELGRQTGDFSVKPQELVRIDTVRSEYQAGEAVSVRINLRSTACMAEPGAWVGLFRANTPRLRGREAAAILIRGQKLRGRPWEELFFEAPRQPGAYEVRTYTSQLRGGTVTGAAKIAVVPREQGCRGFTGTWKTNFGQLRLTVRGRKARGSYRRKDAYRAGFLIGKVKGRVLYGQWQSELGGGGTRLVLSEDGKSFNGTWSHFRDEFAGTGTWKGACDGPVKRQSKAEGE